MPLREKEMMNKLKTVPVLLTGLLSMMAAMASSSLYMEVPGITGPVTAVNYSGWINVMSFSLGYQKATCNSLSVRKLLDMTSPPLTMAAVAGTFYPTVTLVSVVNSDSPREEFRLKLFNAAVINVQQAGSGETPTESLSFQPSSVEVTYYVQSANGSTTQAVTSTVDCQAVKVR